MITPKPHYDDEKITRKELASRAHCSPWRITMAKRFGFTMPAGLASLAEWRAWWAQNGHLITAARGAPRRPQNTPAKFRQLPPTPANM